ncbi:MAG TPA: thioredoxin [Caldilineaceae bacterium]|nr:thioredoxin [Caldilineaceae bacterium]
MPIDTVIHTNQYSIDRVLQAGLPVLLVFWRADVPQSIELDKTLDDLARAYAGRALVAKIDAAAEQPLVQRFDIRLLPSVVAVKGGKTEAVLAGRVADSDLRAWLSYLVQGGARPPVTSGPGAPAAASGPIYTNGKGSHASTAGATTGSTAGRAASDSIKSSSTQPVTLTDANFQQVVSGPGPVLVDFWAPWCGPCRMVAPSVEALAKEFAGRAVVAKLNVDENPMTASRYNIMSIPALFIFRNGQVVEQIIGAQPLPVLRAKLAQYAR